MAENTSLIKRWWPTAAFILVAIWFLPWVIEKPVGQVSHGFGTYYTAGRLISQGGFTVEVYDPNYFRPLVRSDSLGRADDIWGAQIPTTALYFWPLSWASSYESARQVWTWFNLGLLFAVVALLVRVFAGRWDASAIFLVGTATMLFWPVVDNLRWGQAYILVFAFQSLALAVFSQRRKQPRVLGLILALSLLLKIIAWQVLLLLVWLGRWRTLFVTAVAAGTSVLLTLPLFSPEMWLQSLRLLRRWTSSPYVCVPAYQTTRSWLCHLFSPEILWPAETRLNQPWPATAVFWGLAIVTLGITLWLAGHQPAAGYMSMIVWGLLFAPLGEGYHHTLVLIPVTWLLVVWRGGRLNGYARLYLILALLFYWLPFDVNESRLQSGWLALAAYPRLFGAWLVWGAIITAGSRDLQDVHSASA